MHLQFIPGKGIRNKEEVLLSLSNPAQLGKGKSTGELYLFTNVFDIVMTVLEFLAFVKVICR